MPTLAVPYRSKTRSFLLRVSKGCNYRIDNQVDYLEQLQLEIPTEAQPHPVEGAATGAAFPHPHPAFGKPFCVPPI